MAVSTLVSIGNWPVIPVYFFTIPAPTKFGDQSPCGSFARLILNNLIANPRDHRILLTVGRTA